MSAPDVLQLRSNEGEFFSEDLKLLFAGSYAHSAFNGISLTWEQRPETLATL